MVCHLLYKSSRVAHVAAEDYNYGDKDDEDAETFGEGLATAIPAPNNAFVFNLEA